MERIDQLRSSRNSPHQIFGEYLKMRAKSADIFLIFEGKHCSSLYIKWVTQQLGSRKIGGQVIARGKKNVLALREIIRKNVNTCGNPDIYFVDKDYDDQPRLGTFCDVYVSRGYSIENEVSSWDVLEPYIRAYFDLADSSDQEALLAAKRSFHQIFEAYINQSKECQRVIFICSTRSLYCLPGENIFKYLDIDWHNANVRQTYLSIDALLCALKIESKDRNEILTQLIEGEASFDTLDPTLDWRGKFHFSFVKKFLMYLRDARNAGTLPFSRPAKVDVDPSHPGVIGILGTFSPTPKCLLEFLNACLTQPNFSQISK